MERQNFSAVTDAVPRIVVTEPSPVPVQTQSTVSIIRQIEAIPEDIANGSGITSKPAKMAVEQAAAAPEPGSSTSSGEFKPAKDCNNCTVDVPEQSSSESADDASTATLEADHDLRTAEGCCQNCGLLCIDWYDRVWKAMNNVYTIPVWFFMLGVPMSAGIMGAFHIHDCPASPSLSQLIFTIGVSLMIVIALRICLIIGRFPVTSAEDQGCMKMMHTLLLISSLLTTIFFITESVSYWKMKPSSVPGADFCDPKLQTFAFWWNCIMCVVIVPIFLFPA